MRFRVLVLAIALTATATTACDAAPCPGNDDALGTARVLAVDAATTPRVGRKHFPQTLPLARNEVVLTFDDGPFPGTTGRVLDALRHECVKATFFLLGRMVQAHPELARRERADGHTVAHHSFSHPLLGNMPLDRAEAEIQRGMVAVDTALYDHVGAEPVTPFFRFPGFVSSGPLLQYLQRRGIVVFGADLWASDWNRMTPDQELHLVMERLIANQGGILLLHDTKAQTASMLPSFLRQLKGRGFQIVHVVPKEVSTAPSGK